MHSESVLCWSLPELLYTPNLQVFKNCIHLIKSTSNVTSPGNLFLTRPETYWLCYLPLCVHTSNLMYGSTPLLSSELKHQTLLLIEEPG